MNVHMEYEGLNNSESQFFQGKKNGKQECVITRIIPDDDGMFTDLVRNSVSTQTRGGARPMFMNNYLVGDNSWRPGSTEGSMRLVDESIINSGTNCSFLSGRG